MKADDATRRKRWRLVLGGGSADGTGTALDERAAAMDACLAALYEDLPARGEAGTGPAKRGGLGGSAPRVARWLGDVRRFFPAPVVTVMQKDAFERVGLSRMLLEPELLETVTPDVHLVATLVSLKGVIPARSKDAARAVVRRVVDELMARLAEPMREAVRGSIRRSTRNRRPRFADIDWPATIRANLRHYQPEYRTVIPEVLRGFGRRSAALKDVILLVDESGSMAPSVVYSGIFAAVLASIPAVRTRLVVFDTEVVDLTDELAGDPVDVLFGIQLGGGTDIAQALRYGASLVERPTETTLVLVSDLCEGGDVEEMKRRAASLVAAGVNVIVLLALSDDGAPWFDRDHAGAFAGMGIPVFACTPHHFPDLMAAAIARRDVGEWAGERGLVTARPRDDG